MRVLLALVVICFSSNAIAAMAACKNISGTSLRYKNEEKKFEIDRNSKTIKGPEIFNFDLINKVGTVTLPDPFELEKEVLVTEPLKILFADREMIHAVSGSASVMDSYVFYLNDGIMMRAKSAYTRPTFRPRMTMMLGYECAYKVD